jgi:hypothetical protein
MLCWIRLRKTTGDSRYYAAVEKKRAEGDGLLRMIVVSCYKPFELIIFERMALLIDLWRVLLRGPLFIDRVAHERTDRRVSGVR